LTGADTGEVQGRGRAKGASLGRTKARLHSFEHRCRTSVPVDGKTAKLLSRRRSDLKTRPKITKSVSEFLAQNRAKNDASNRIEFLESLAQKRRRLNLDPESTDPIPSCARTDAKHLDRDSQMKYDIAKNEDGPLRRTIKGAVGKEMRAEEKLVALSDDSPSNHQPAIDERLKNIETHLAVRYGMSRFLLETLPLMSRHAVPAPPRTLLARLQFLETHITQLEKEYPPWAALHFNQPNRGVSSSYLVLPTPLIPHP
jgi:hypothetical protein